MSEQPSAPQDGIHPSAGNICEQPRPELAPLPHRRLARRKRLRPATVLGTLLMLGCGVVAGLSLGAKYRDASDRST
jgi:hypothetical protein